jgi:hypothetical protein
VLGSPNPAQLRREVLEPLAASLGLDYDAETLRPGNSPPQLAYGFVSCGADLLLGYSYPDGVPSLDRRTRKRVAKAVAGGFRSAGARQAAVLLAQGLGTYMYETLHRAGHETDAQHHLSFRALVQQHFALPDELVDRLDAARVEYRTFETREVRREVRVGVETWTGYHMALLDPAFLDGRDPYSDETMVQTQKRYAGRYLRGHVGLIAIRLTIGADAYTAAEDKLLVPGRSMAAESLIFEASEQSLWSQIAEDWRTYAQLAVGNALPDEHELVSVIDDPVAIALRDGTERMLEDGPPEPLPERSREVFERFAHDMTAGEADWNAAVDALAMGYYVRCLECEMVEFNSLDPETTGNLTKWAEHEPEMALAGGALTVADSMPAAFAAGGQVWEQLRSWAAEQALQRSWARHHAGTEDGRGPTLSVEEFGRAFELGYGIRFAEETLRDAGSPPRTTR